MNLIDKLSLEALPDDYRQILDEQRRKWYECGYRTGFRAGRDTAIQLLNGYGEEEIEGTLPFLDHIKTLSEKSES